VPRKRKAPEYVWVKQGGGTIPVGIVNPDKLQNKSIKRGVVVKGELVLDGRSVAVERITKSAFRKRESVVWVVKDTNVQLGDSFNKDTDLNDSVRNEAGELIAGNAIYKGKQLPVERIAKNMLIQREPVWVIKGTKVKLKAVDLNSLRQPITYNTAGLPISGKFEIDSKLEDIECITKDAVRRRGSVVWVVKDTNVQLGDSFNAATDLSAPVFDNAGKPIAGSAIYKGKQVPVERITKNALNFREPVWVIKGTNMKLKSFHIKSLRQPVTYNTAGLPISGKFEIDSKLEDIECITKDALRRRESVVWVVKDTNIQLGDSFNKDTDLIAPVCKETGELIAGKALYNGKQVPVECITNDALRRREPVWVIKGTNMKLKSFDLNSLIQPITYNAAGLPISGKFEFAGKLEDVESIAISTLKKRKSRIAKARTSALSAAASSFVPGYHTGGGGGGAPARIVKTVVRQRDGNEALQSQGKRHKHMI
jgi:hypothetical protein